MRNLFMVLFFQESTAPDAAAGAAATGIMVIWLAVLVLMIAAMWKVFDKAGEPGWAAIVPIYNLYVMLKIAGKPGWWLILMLIPFVNLVVGIIMYIAFAQAFGKGAGFGLGLLFLGPIFFPILAWGEARYRFGNESAERFVTVGLRFEREDASSMRAQSASGYTPGGAPGSMRRMRSVLSRAFTSPLNAGGTRNRFSGSVGNSSATSSPASPPRSSRTAAVPGPPETIVIVSGVRSTVRSYTSTGTTSMTSSGS